MTMWLCLFAIAGMISSGLFIAAVAMDAEGGDQGEGARARIIQVPPATTRRETTTVGNRTIESWRSYFSLIVRLISVPQLSQT
jgi:hypothetical protein